MASVGSMSAVSSSQTTRCFSGPIARDSFGSSDDRSHSSLECSSQPCFQGRSLSVTRRPPQTAAPRSPSALAARAASSSPFTANESQDDVAEWTNGDDDKENILDSSSEFLETINAVVADVVDGQKYLKETGRTKPRPMKRRSLVVCLALGVMRPYVSDVEQRLTNLRRTSSNTFAKTCALVSQLSFGASKAGRYIAEQRELEEAEANNNYMPAMA